jgi:hypothetical protein
MSHEIEHRLLELLEEVRANADLSARAELNQILRTNPAARSVMARSLVNEHAIISRMRDDGIAAMLEPTRHAPSVPQPSFKPQRLKTKLVPLSAAAVVIFACFLTWLALHPRKPKAAPVPIEPVAILKEDADAVWLDSSPAPGGALAAGKLKLASGMAAIEFNSGARILLEGPAEIDLISAMKAKLAGGRILADVPPPAHGFAIETPDTTIIDRGTSFGVSVNETGGTLLKVISGKVDLVNGPEVSPVTRNRSVTIRSGGKITTTSIPDEAFPSAASFARRVAKRDQTNASRWRITSGNLSSSTLLHYNFEESSPTSRAARNHSPTALMESHASIVGTRWTDGRWPDKRAIEFTSLSDRMLFKLNGTHPAATFLAWLRVDSLGNPYHILLMPDSSKPSALQWMIDANGNLRMAITNHLGEPASARGWEGPVKAAAISNLDFGRWIFLASTYDSSTGEIVHYRDGEPIGSGFVNQKLPVSFSSFSFGNWPSGSNTVRDEPKQDRYRNFVGRLDELAILSRALQPDEIRQIFRSGKP